MNIILDLDLTLLTSKGELTEKTKQVLNRCAKEGHTIIINSARSFLRSVKFAKDTHAKYINCFHGNLIVDKLGNTLYEKPFNLSNVEELLDGFANIYNGWVGVECKDSAFCTNEKVGAKIGANLIEKKDIKTLKIFKFIFEIDQSKKEEYKLLADKLGVNIIFNREAVFCTLMPKDTDKWFGLQRILNQNEKSIAFGDDVTDVLTLNNVDIPVVMANSREEILKKYQTHALSNDEDGVAVYLENNLLKKPLN